jgi:energy-coupling factor transporter ATP-binding protein EcfA2
MELWYRQLGFYNNPFSIKPAAYHDNLYGYDVAINEVVGKIKDGGIIFVEGDYGAGKSTLLKKIIHAYGGKKEVVYYSCNITENKIDTEKLIEGRKKGFWSRIFFSGDGENLILLLDEAQDMSKEDSEEVMKAYGEKKFKTVILVSKDLKKMNFGDGMRKTMGKDNMIKLGKLNEDAAIKMIRKRIGNTKLLSDNMIKTILKKSDYNPRKLLKNCEEVCKYAVENIEDAVKEEHVKKVLG